MLLPRDINPELSIYYNGAIILEQLNNIDNIHLLNLFENVKERNNMSLNTFILSLDWLFLVNIAIVTESGEVRLCL